MVSRCAQHTRAPHGFNGHEGEDLEEECRRTTQFTRTDRQSENKRADNWKQ